MTRCADGKRLQSPAGRYGRLAAGMLALTVAVAHYFKLSAGDVARVVKPAAYGPHTVLKAGDAAKVKAAFRAANPGLPAGGLTTAASKGVLTEVDICLTKAGAFRPC